VVAVISVRSNVKQLQKRLGNLEQRQLPYATALGLTSLAHRVKDAETEALPQVFDRPTPFTMRAFGVVPARKNTLTAIVFARPVQARYLAPFEDGGAQLVGRGRRVRTPVGISLNAYGNIRAGAIRRGAAKPNTFVGHVKGTGGLWQRMPAGRLKLLVAFTRPKSIAPRLGYRARAEQIVRTWFETDMSTAIRRALQSAR
jgi:hypothetical protein